MMKKQKFYKPIERYTLWLNTEQGCQKKVSSDGLKNVEFSWDFSDIPLSEYAIMRLFAISHYSATEDTANKIIQVRIKGVDVNYELYRGDKNGGYPMLFAGSWTNNESAYFDHSLSGLCITNKPIRNITLIISDDMTNPDAGVLNTLQFMIGISIEPYDRKVSDVEF